MDNERRFVNGICCFLCKYENSDDCPVKNATPRGRHVDFCGRFEDMEEEQTVKEVFINKLKV